MIPSRTVPARKKGVFMKEDLMVSIGFEIATFACLPLQEKSIRQRRITRPVFLNIDKSYAYSVADKLGHVLALKLDHDAGLMVLHCF